MKYLIGAGTINVVVVDKSLGAFKEIFRKELRRCSVRDFR